MSIEGLEERLTLTASPLTGGIHAAVVVAPPGIAGSATTIAASNTRPSFGQAVVLTTTVSPATPGGATPTGNVTFFDDTVVLGVVPLVNGSASISTWSEFLAGDINSVHAAYWGDAQYAVSDSPYLDLTVSKANTTTALTATPGSGSVNFTATVTPAGTNAGTPTGVVAFYDGGKLVGSVQLVDGKATLNQGMNGSGRHAFTAAYYGDSGYNASSTKAPTVQALAVDSSQTTLTVRTAKNAQGATIGLGLYASVTDPRTGHAPLTGTVTFSVDGRVVRISPLSAQGTTGVFVPLKVAKGHTFTASYSGMTGVRASTSTLTF